MDATQPFLFVGGHPALDLLNTVVGQGAARLDLLDDTASLRSWLDRIDDQALADIVSAIRAAPDHEWRGVAAKVRQVRELGRDMLDAWRDRGKLPRVAELREWMAQVAYVQDLRLDGGEWRVTWVPAAAKPAALPGILAGSIARLLADEALSSIKSCQGEGCSMQFVDRTKAQHRLYCSAQLCGNRAKVAAFRARQRGGDGSS